MSSVGYLARICGSRRAMVMRMECWAWASSELLSFTRPTR